MLEFIFEKSDKLKKTDWKTKIYQLILAKFLFSISPENVTLG